MDWRAECVVVIPCLNEAGTIGALVCEVQRFLPRVIVVDDGSRDGTGKIAAEAGAVVVRHAEARGKGAALQSGWARARESGFAWALAMDGDAQHSPGDISTFLKRAAAGDVALVVGNRMANPAGMPWLRRVVNGWMSRRLSKAASRRCSTGRAARGSRPSASPPAVPPQAGVSRPSAS